MKNRRHYPAVICVVAVLFIALSLFPVTGVKSQNENKAFTNSIGAEFVLIPAGNFMMGSPPDEQGRDSKETLHKVAISKPFYMQITEVTQEQWEVVMGKKSSPFHKCGNDGPAGSVSWEQAIEFVLKLNKKEGVNRYRLPTEAEWEYACRADSNTVYNWGDTVDCSKSNYGNFFSNECLEENPEASVKTRCFQPNLWGLYDMHGNIGEWCQDGTGITLQTMLPIPKGLPRVKAVLSGAVRGGSGLRKCAPLHASTFRRMKDMLISVSAL